MVEIERAGGVFPSQIESEGVDRLAIRQTVQPLQHHRHRDNPRRHRVAADHREEIREFLVREQTMALARQQALDRFRPQPRFAGRARRAVQVFLIR